MASGPGDGSPTISASSRGPAAAPRHMQARPTRNTATEMEALKMDLRPRTYSEQEILDMFELLNPSEKALAIKFMRAVRDDDKELADALENDLRTLNAETEGKRKKV